MNKNKSIGVDVGGTKIHFALIDAGKVVKETRISTNASGTQEELFDDLRKGVGELLDDTVKGVGIGLPGLVDSSAGIVRNVLNIPAWKNAPVKEAFEKHFNIPVEIGNDANCFALGEKYYGKAQKYSDIVALCMGTGIGAGVLINNIPYIGNQTIAGEFGGIKYLDSDYETYCSGKFFSIIHGADATIFAEKAENGDSAALELFKVFGNHVGYLIQTIIYSYGPQAIILGGSLTKSYKFFKSGMDENLANFPHKNVLNATFIDISDNPSIAVLGASSLVGV